MPMARISDTDRNLLRYLARETGKQQQQILHEALDRYHREHQLAQINTAFARLKENPEAWAHELEERAAWDATLGDGLADD